MQFCMLDEPDCNDPFDCLRQECQIENWSIGIHVFRIEIRLFQPWAKFKAFNMFGKLPSPSDMLHIFVIVPGSCQIRHQSFDEPCWSWVQHAVFHRSLARSLRFACQVAHIIDPLVSGPCSSPEPRLTIGPRGFYCCALVSGTPCLGLFVTLICHWRISGGN